MVLPGVLNCQSTSLLNLIFYHLSLLSYEKVKYTFSKEKDFYITLKVKIKRLNPSRSHICWNKKLGQSSDSHLWQY